jgi:hypothetical protein
VSSIELVFGRLLIHELADRLGLTGGLSRACASAFRAVRVHDPGMVLRDLAVMIADGGDCLSHLCGVDIQAQLGKSSGAREIESIPVALPHLGYMLGWMTTGRPHVKRSGWVFIERGW